MDWEPKKLLAVACRKYTFFKPKFIIYATYLSEKIGYWRYISIYRHLQRNPDNQLYPLFEYFENWCQDESRHGDFFTAILKVRGGTQCSRQQPAGQLAGAGVLSTAA